MAERRHEIVGRIAEIGDYKSEISGCKKGDRVVVETRFGCGVCKPCIQGKYNRCEKKLGYGFMVPCTEPPYLWGAYSEYLYLPERAILHKINEDVPSEAAVLACAVLGNSVNWLQRIGGVAIGDTVVIMQFYSVSSGGLRERSGITDRPDKIFNIFFSIGGADELRIIERRYCACRIRRRERILVDHTAQAGTYLYTQFCPVDMYFLGQQAQTVDVMISGEQMMRAHLVFILSSNTSRYYHGCNVTAVDGSAGLCRQAAQLTGLDVKCMS